MADSSINVPATLQIHFTGAPLNASNPVLPQDTVVIKADMLHEADLLLRYHDRIRQSIAAFDGLVVDILSKGATLVIAILIVPWSLLHFSSGLKGVETVSVFTWLSYVSIAAVLASAYITFAVSLYADLLLRSVHLGIKIESDFLKDSNQRGLTTILDQSALAGGRNGKYLYGAFAILLYVATAAVSLIYFDLGGQFVPMSWLPFISISPFRLFFAFYMVLFLIIIGWSVRSWSSFKGLK
jgi:hypothetical protein